MKRSDIPHKSPGFWAYGAASQYVASHIPDGSQANGHISWIEGFPPLTFQPTAAGGSPPWGSDANKILQFITQWVRWFQSGGPVNFDHSFATDPNLSGYPRGAVVGDPNVPGMFWYSLIDDNTDPLNTPASWAIFPPHGSALFRSTGNWTVPPLVLSVQFEIVGGAGGGGGSNGSGGVGTGAGGGETIVGTNTVTPGANFSVVIGSGGFGGHGGSGPQNGGAGGNSTIFGLTAHGGAGGTAGNGAIATIPTPGGSGSPLFGVSYPGYSGQYGFSVAAGGYMQGQGGPPALMGSYAPAVGGGSSPFAGANGAMVPGQGGNGGVSGGAGQAGADGECWIRW